MRNIAIKNFAVMACLILLCIVAADSATKFMSNVPDAARWLPDIDNITSKLVEGFKKCLICGCSHDDGLHENIIGGNEVDPPNKYPWMVQVIKKDSLQTVSLCGGAILDGYHILSAAHCVVHKENCIGPLASCKAKPGEVVIAFLTSNSNEKRQGPPVEEIFIHPQYKLASAALVLNDIAVVRLMYPITCDAYASPICLPPSKFSVPAKWMLGVAGWGMNFFHYEEQTTRTTPNLNQRPPPLLEAKVMALNKSRCGFSQQSDPAVHCVVGTQEKTACFGDSGGPLFSKEKVVYTLGIASVHTSFICDWRAPMIFTDVRKFMNYIQYVTGLVSAQEVEVQRKNRRKRNNKRRT